MRGIRREYLDVVYPDLPQLSEALEVQECSNPPSVHKLQLCRCEWLRHLFSALWDCMQYQTVKLHSGCGKERKKLFTQSDAVRQLVAYLRPNDDELLARQKRVPSVISKSLRSGYAVWRAVSHEPGLLAVTNLSVYPTRRNYTQLECFLKARKSFRRISPFRMIVARSLRLLVRTVRKEKPLVYQYMQLAIAKIVAQVDPLHGPNAGKVGGPFPPYPLSQHPLTATTTSQQLRCGSSCKYNTSLSSSMPPDTSGGSVVDRSSEPSTNAVFDFSVPPTRRMEFSLNPSLQPPIDTDFDMRTSANSYIQPSFNTSLGASMPTMPSFDPMMNTNTSSEPFGNTGLDPSIDAGYGFLFPTNPCLQQSINTDFDSLMPSDTTSGPFFNTSPEPFINTPPDLLMPPNPYLQQPYFNTPHDLVMPANTWSQQPSFDSTLEPMTPASTCPQQPSFNTTLEHMTPAGTSLNYSNHRSVSDGQNSLMFPHV